MQERGQAGTGQPRPVNQAGMGQLVHQHRILPVRNGGNHPQGGCVTGGKADRRFSPLQISQGLLQTGMRPARPRDQAGSHGPGPAITRRTGKSLRQGRMMSQAQVIITCQVDYLPAVLHAGHAAGQAIHIPQNAQQSRGLQL